MKKRIPAKDVKKVKRKKFSRLVEKAIWEKYDHRCAICGRRTSFDDGEIDHIKPLAKGGTNKPSNLQWLCHRCNKLKGSKRTNYEVKQLLGITKNPLPKINQLKRKQLKEKQ